MARIAGIDIPKNKRGEIGLTYIFGIGRSTAQYILTKAGIDFNKKVNQWNDEEQGAWTASVHVPHFEELANSCVAPLATVMSYGMAPRTP